MINKVKDAFYTVWIMVWVLFVGPWTLYVDVPTIPRLRYKGYTKDNFGRPTYRFTSRVGDRYVTLDESEERIVQDGYLLSKGRMGSGAIGVMIFSIPTAILFSPLLFLTGAYFRAKEKIFGMSRYACLLLRRARCANMPEAEYEHLKRVLKNDWARRQERLEV